MKSMIDRAIEQLAICDAMMGKCEVGSLELEFLVAKRHRLCMNISEELERETEYLRRELGGIDRYTTVNQGLYY